MKRPALLSLCFLLLAALAASTATAQNPAIRLLREKEMLRAATRADRGAVPANIGTNYDVGYYRLDVTMRRDVDAFTGVATVRCRALATLDTVLLNAADNLTVSSVRVDGVDAVFTRPGTGLLAVALAQPAAPGAELTLRIAYGSRYAESSAIAYRRVYNVDRRDSTVSISTQAEPYDGRAWWPCKDDPSDKADSADVVITTDTSLTAVSNGRRIADTDNGDGTHTVHWQCRYPIATYLVMVAIAGYNHTAMTFTHGGRSMDVGNWYYGMSAAMMAQNEVDMLEGLRVYSDLFIPYPYMNEKYGMAEYEAFGGAMEHQTCSSMGFYGTDVVVHELSHQWFGDKVTCRDFGHVWLNEGWATYCEALFHEAVDGVDALHANMAATAYYGPGTIFVENAEGQGMSQIFDGNLSYNKGSWVVHMLRHIVGDSVFFRATRRYLGGEDPAAYRTATTEEFEALFEQESGKDLSAFFRNWIYGEYYPTYRITWNAAPSAGAWDVTVAIDQLYTPARQVFTMPIDLTFRFAGYDSTVVVQDSTAGATFSFRFADKPASVLLDKDNWILKRVVQPVLNPAFDRGILLVNGVDWDVDAYTADIKAAFADSAFTGSQPYAFWDLFPNPWVGYPANITSIAGVGAVPADEIGHYCTVVWLGNVYNGDETFYANSPIWEYIKAGGNLVLITRQGREFISGELLSMLGITWVNAPGSGLRSCASRDPRLLPMSFTGEQTLVAPFSTTLTRPENVLLFADTAGANPLGIGVWAKPVDVGGTPSGHAVYLAMRPYRIERQALRRNMDALLADLPCVPRPVGTDAAPAAPSVDLAQNYPNPTSGATSFAWTVPGTAPRHVTLRLYSALGRLVATLADETQTAGAHRAAWNGAGLAPGVYTYVLAVDGVAASRTMLVIR
jgi:hypothetical protein